LNQEYGNLEKELAHYTRALGHPARIAILLEISKRGNHIKGETLDIPPLSATTVLQHLRELKRAGLIHGRVFGNKADYSLDINMLLKFNVSFLDFMTQIQDRKTS
jgi:ArsR family transcriptional regulator